MNMFRIKNVIRGIINKTGWDLRHYRPRLDEARAKLILEKNVDVVLDVGAFVGDFALQLRGDGYDGSMVSFEPVLKAFQKLSKRSDNDPLWYAEQLALGPKEGVTTINVGDKIYTSSVLEYGVAYKGLDPELRSEPQEVQMARLDSWVSRSPYQESRVFMKLDVQGYERQVLEGAKGILNKVQMIQIELSLVGLYSGTWKFTEAVSWFERNGYELYQIERVFEDCEHSRLLQLDGLFVRP